jgi:response regulator RpfG family c-di-GMP phosphodiesterase
MQPLGEEVPNSTPAPGAAAPHALVVCAEADDRTFLVRTLRRAGWSVQAAANGHAGQELLVQTQPDLVLLDVELPDYSGVALARRWRQTPAGQNVAVLALQRAEDAVQAEMVLNAGADQVAARPLTRYELSTRAQSLLNLSRSRTEATRASDRRAELTRGLVVLADLSLEVSGAGGLDEILAHALHAAVGVVPAREVCLLLRTLTPGQLVVAGAQGRRFGAVGTRLPADLGDLGRALASGTLIVGELPADPARGRHAAQIAYIPLRSPEPSWCAECLGVLTIAGRINGALFCDSDLAFLEMLASRIATAIHEVLTRCWNDRARDALVRSLVTLTECRDESTGFHLDRVTTYAVLLAELLVEHPDFRGMIDEEFLRNLRWTAPLHDVGKVGVPDSILLKPGRLTPAERQIMQTHATIGGDTLRLARDGAPESAMLKMAEEIARCHHEWWNGAGYPRGLAGDDIPLAARIVALADVYDAVTTRRPYKEAATPEAAADLVRAQNGVQFDPRVVDAFAARQEVFAEFARGTSNHGRAPVLPAALPWWLAEAKPGQSKEQGIEGSRDQGTARTQAPS